MRRIERLKQNVRRSIEDLLWDLRSEVQWKLENASSATQDPATLETAQEAYNAANAVLLTTQLQIKELCKLARQ